jgi:hypothetical protein
LFSKSSLQRPVGYENKELTKNTAGTPGLTREQEPIMLKEIKSVLSRSSATIWQDILGGVGLMVVLYGGLQLPGMI